MNTFQLNLQNDKGPRSYRWRVPAPIEEPKTGHWQFLVDGAWNDPRPPEKAKKKRALQPTQLY